MTAFLREFRNLLPVWAVALVLPLPILEFWTNGSARFYALDYVFLGNAIVAAECFRMDNATPNPSTPQSAVCVWYAKFGAVLMAGLLSAIIFSVASLSLAPEATSPIGIPLFSALAIVPAVCIVPYFTLVTKKPFAAVVLACFVTGACKLMGDVIALLAYGPHAEELGYLSATWTHPNLLAWVFFICSAICSGIFCVLGFRRFVHVC
jgi:hypothetical protein